MADLDFQPTLDFKSGGLDFQPTEENPARQFEEMPALERAVKGPSAALETAVRGGLSFVTGLAGKTAGTAVGALETGTIPGAVEKGRKWEEAMQIPALQKGSAYFDEKVGEGLNWLKDKWVDLSDEGGNLDKKSYEDLRREAAKRSISESLFDSLMVAFLRGKPRAPKAELPKIEEGIKKGAEGPQGELDFQEGPLNPPTMEGQPNRSPYNLPATEIERLERELNPPTEQRVAGQGELFTGEEAYTKDELQARKYQLEEAQGGGRFKTPDMDRQVASEMNTKEGLGGATEQSNLSADLFERPGLPRHPDEPIPYKPHLKYDPRKGPGKFQRGEIDPDLLTFGVSALLRSEGFKKTMEKFKGTFSKAAINEAIKESENPNSKTTIVFMSPDKFRELAMKRIEGQTPSEKANAKIYLEGIHEPIKKALKTEHGLDDIPELYLSSERGAQPGATIHSVWAHEGRHRADVFAERGLELMPVRVTHSGITWGRASEIGELPRKVISENGVFQDFPQPENWKPEQDLDFSKITNRPVTNTGPAGRQRGTIDLTPGGFAKRANFKKEMDKVVEKEGLVSTLLDARKQFQMEKRDLAPMIKEEGVTASNLEDLSLKGKALSNLAIDRTMSILSETKGGVGKIIKWAVDHISEIERTDNLASEKDLYGEKYKPGIGNFIRPFEKRVRGEEGILSLWKDTHREGTKGRQEVRGMLDVAIDKIGKGATRDDFKSDKQFKIYEAVQNGFDNLRERLNEARAKSNLGPIQKLEGFLPSSWEGDYRTHIYDGAGNHKMSFGFENKWQADRAVKALRKEHPDMVVKDAQHITMDKTDIGDLSAFEEAIRLLGKDDPVTKALQKTMVELRSSRGFGKHGLQKTGVLGFLGMEKGDLGVRNMERSIEQYIRQGNRYISNMEKARLQSQLDSLPIDMQKAIPKTLDYLHDYIDNSRGKDIDRMPIVKDLFAGLSEWAKFGQSGPQTLIRESSSVASLYFLVTPRFAISQIVQHLNAIPKYVMMHHEGTFTDPASAVWKGWEHFTSPDKLAMDGANWAMRQGHLDSALVAMLDMKFGDVTTQRLGMLKDAVSVSFGKLEKNAVRLPTFLAMEYGLRKSIPDHNLRYETAANMMDYYMVHYSESSRPLLYGKLGLVGDAVRQFKQYSHNSFGQLFEYMQYGTKEGGSWAPLVTHLAIQTSLAGLKGTPLVVEAAAAVAVFNALSPALNAMLPDDKQIPHIPSPIDWLMNSKMHDAFVFGGLSTALGYDVSSSVNAPNVPQMFSAPAVEFPVKAIVAGSHWLMNKLAGVDTEQDQLKAALALSPSAMHGWIEELFAKPGEPNPMQGQKDLKGNYIRSTTESLMAKFFAVKSLSEARMNSIVGAFKKEMARDLNAKVSALDAIVDRVANGKNPDDKLIQSYIENGGDVGRLHDNIVRRIQERNMDFADRQTYNKQLTPAEIHKLEAMKSMLDRKEQNRRERKGTEPNAKNIGLFSSNVINPPKEGSVSDSFPRKDVHGIEAQATRAHQQYRTEREQLARRNKVSEGDLIQQEFGVRAKAREEMNQLKEMRMKNRLIQM